jgi:Fungal chitosanase of glycosyl hydrolase group 75
MSTMKAKDFLFALAQLPALDVTEGLLKEKRTVHIGQRAVWVETTMLDLDTDGGNDPGIKWDKTHQSDTSLHWPKGSPVDSNATRFLVIPGAKKGSRNTWGSRHNLKVGDVGLACVAGCEEVIAFIVADIGPFNKIGEGSIAFHRAAGHETLVDGRIKDVGMDGPFHMVIFPNSGDGVCHNNDFNEKKAFAFFAALTASVG